MVCGFPAPTLNRSPAMSDSAAAKKCRGDIDGVDEVPALGSVTDNREGFSGELLLEKDAKDRAIDARRSHAGAVGIEDAD